MTGVFLIGYGLARITGEMFREPDEFLGFLQFGATMGQLLSIPMVLVGLWLALRSRPRLATQARIMRSGGSLSPPCAEDVRR